MQNRFDKWAETYDKSILNYLIFNSVRKKICNILGNLEDKKVLDVGCGTGTLLKELAEKNPNSYFIGIDSSKKMIEAADKKKIKNLEFFIRNSENLNFPEERFDYILSSFSFHHWPNQEKSIENCYRILKKQGKLIIVDLSLPIYLLGGKGTTKILTSKEMKKLFKSKSFEVKQYPGANFWNLGYYFEKITIGEKY